MRIIYKGQFEGVSKNDREGCAGDPRISNRGVDVLAEKKLIDSLFGIAV
jgi:hypothetical protein